MMMGSKWQACGMDLCDDPDCFLAGMARPHTHTLSTGTWTQGVQSNAAADFLIQIFGISFLFLFFFFNSASSSNLVGSFLTIITGTRTFDAAAMREPYSST